MFHFFSIFIAPCKSEYLKRALGRGSSECYCMKCARCSMLDECISANRSLRTTEVGKKSRQHC